MRALLRTLEDYRERLIAADEWDEWHEGTWEEYAKPGGCMYGDEDATLAYLADLSILVGLTALMG